MIKFSKMHGLGNDFVVIDLITQQIPLSPGVISHLANRNFGIGFDQLLVVEAPSNPEVDFKYRIFNADGSEVAQCGNGARCFAVFVKQAGLTRKNTLVVETRSGIITLYVSDNGMVKVNMGLPSFSPEQIPFNPTNCVKAESDTQLHYSIPLDNNIFVQGMVANVGNPHVVLTVDDVLSAEVLTTGAALESHSYFPERVNVGFMQIMDKHHIRLRVFERGAGETLACGTGACAAAICGIRSGALESPVEVQLAGGVLSIEWKNNETVWMTGPTKMVFEGSISIEDLLYS